MRRTEEREKRQASYLLRARAGGQARQRRTHAEAESEADSSGSRRRGWALGDGVGGQEAGGGRQAAGDEGLSGRRAARPCHGAACRWGCGPGRWQLLDSVTSPPGLI